MELLISLCFLMFYLLAKFLVIDSMIEYQIRKKHGKSYIKTKINAYKRGKGKKEFKKIIYHFFWIDFIGEYNVFWFYFNFFMFFVCLLYVFVSIIYQFGRLELIYKFLTNIACFFWMFIVFTAVLNKNKIVGK